MKINLNRMIISELRNMEKLIQFNWIEINLGWMGTNWKQMLYLCYHKIIQSMKAYPLQQICIFRNGLLGTGWCFAFLMEDNWLMVVPTNLNLEKIDRQAMTVRCGKLQDCSLTTCLRVIINYVLARIKTACCLECRFLSIKVL